MITAGVTGAQAAPVRSVRPRRVARWWVNLPIRYKGLLVVVLPLLGIAATLGFRVPFARQQQATGAILTHASDTRDMSQELLISLLEIESGIRGYVLTENTAFLARFENARQTVPALLDRLSVLLSNPREQAAYEEIARLVNRELALAADLVSYMRGLRIPGSPSIQERLDEEKAIMDGIRLALGNMRRDHDALVAASRTELERLRRRLTPILYTTFFGGLLAALIAGWLFATGVAARVKALERNAGRLAAGERLRFEPSRGLDEIGSLDRALREASVRQRRRQREVAAAQAELERTVYEQALLNRELEAFSYSVSHDLRAPLRSIDGFAQALREDWGDRLDEAAQDHLSRVRNAAQKMGRLIDDLLKLSRLTRAQVQRVDVDLSRLSREVCEELTERNPSRRVEWVIADRLRASCDPSLARILLDNLLGNAWKFTSKTPDPRIEFTSVPGSKPTIFVVRDNGAGFDMRFADKLFAPFQRLHGEREFPGTGIGLATVQRIVHKHGGEVRTRAAIGEGASFFFTLESAETPMQVPELPPHTS